MYVFFTNLVLKPNPGSRQFLNTKLLPVPRVISGQTPVTGGVAPYTYAVDNGAFSSNNVIGNLVGGSHTFQVKDVNGCGANVQDIITSQSKLVATTSITNVNCFGGSDGVININFMCEW